jgi:hypothetical protein
MDVAAEEVLEQSFANHRSLADQRLNVGLAFEVALR